MHNGFADEEACDYVLLKRALLARRFLTSQTYRQKSRAAKRKDGETLVQFVARSETYPFPCLELSGKERSFKRLVDLQGQLIGSVSAELAGFHLRKTVCNQTWLGRTAS